jgi:hypothetical protein
LHNEIPVKRYTSYKYIIFEKCRLKIHAEICIVSFMKTTLNINDSLLANAKTFAAQQQMSLTRLIEEGLVLRLRSSRVAAPTTKTSKRKLQAVSGRGGLVTGVNPRSNRAMLDAADNEA